LRFKGLSVNRRDFLQTAGLFSAGFAFPKSASLFARESQTAAAPAAWRTFEVTTRVEILKPSGVTRIWLPAALTSETPFQKTLSNTFNVEAGSAKLIESKPDSLGIISAEFPEGAKPVVISTSRVTTRNYAVDFFAPGKAGNANAPKETRADLDYFLRPTKLIPTDGIVKEKADEIIAKASADTDVGKARAIYEWVVVNTFRNPKTRGCGTGDIRFMLETGDLSGKCADLNALYVGLARAAGLPARDVYGIRVAPSELGYKSLGPATENITKAQHCRAEVYLSSYGWVPSIRPMSAKSCSKSRPAIAHSTMISSRRLARVSLAHGK
jgi:transglutaminase-like putative cysteine protease